MRQPHHGTAPRRSFGYVLTAILFSVGSAAAQPVVVGELNSPTDSILLGAPVRTIIDGSSPASADGNVTQASFLWSACTPGEQVKIKFYRPNAEGFGYLDQRGPFEVRSGIQTVPLVPPVPLKQGDVIAITSLATCPNVLQVHPSAGPGGLFYAGSDSTDDYKIVIFVYPRKAITLQATNEDPLSLLGGRFQIDLTATDPRTGRGTTGHAIAGNDRFGYFSLPEFTGDPTFPEIIVKMADATGIPPPFGGSFWFFYSSLTDVTYVLTVQDTRSGRVRTYASGAPLCGKADTNAFPP